MERFDFGNGRVEALSDFHIFSRRDANEPSTEKAAWVLRNLFNSGALKNRASVQLGMEVFRPDIFHQAKQLAVESKKNEIASPEVPALVS